jgi:CubicO group peptidase (beta-lactamase class C family)
MRGGWLFLLVLLAPLPVSAQNRAAFEADLTALREQLRVPAMSAAVVEAGTLVWVHHFGQEAVWGDTVRYPIGSLTKSFAATLALRLVERGKLSLDTPVPEAGDGVTVRHLLSQTAAGTPGVRFLYSSELFARLQPPLERAAGRPFAAALETEVLRPLGLARTTAKPDITPATGLDSTVEDVARFAASFERNALLSGASTAEMFRAPRDPGSRPFPYALGWFVQQIGGEQVRWQFGQRPDASALVLTLPRRRLTFVLLARTDRLSAPFWLQFGDLRWSPAALTFLTRWSRLRVDHADARRVMIEGLLALADGRRGAGRTAAVRASVLAPQLVNVADPVLLAAFARSGEPELRAIGRRIGQRLLAVDPDHPRVQLDLGVLELQDGHPDVAARLLRKIVADGQATPEIERTAREVLAEQR